MKVCKKCKKKVANKSKVCKYCGADVSKAKIIKTSQKQNPPKKNVESKSSKKQIEKKTLKNEPEIKLEVKTESGVKNKKSIKNKFKTKAENVKKEENKKELIINFLKKSILEIWAFLKLGSIKTATFIKFCSIKLAVFIKFCAIRTAIFIKFCSIKLAVFIKFWAIRTAKFIKFCSIKLATLLKFCISKTKSFIKFLILKIKTLFKLCLIKIKSIFSKRKKRKQNRKLEKRSVKKEEKHNKKEESTNVLENTLVNKTKMAIEKQKKTIASSKAVRNQKVRIFARLIITLGFICLIIGISFYFTKGSGTEEIMNIRGVPATNEKLFSEGDVIEYKGVNYKVANVKLSEGNGYSIPKEGDVFLIVTIYIMNDTKKPINYGYNSWVMTSNNGEAKKIFSSINVDDALYSGQLKPGATKRGSIIFEEKSDAKKIKLSFYELEINQNKEEVINKDKKIFSVNIEMPKKEDKK